MAKRAYKHTKKQWIKWYNQKVEMMGDAYVEVTPLEFYKDMLLLCLISHVIYIALRWYQMKRRGW